MAQKVKVEEESPAPVIEKERWRKDLGDLTTLKKSIKEIGQIHPIINDTNGKLIIGARRLQACIELGIEPVYRTVDFNNPEQAEIDENTCRKDFTPSEIFEINKYYNEKLSKQGNRTDINFGTNDTEVKKQPRNVVSDITGVGTATLSKINTIYESDNEDLKKKVDDKEISVDKGYKEAKNEAVEALKEVYDGEVPPAAAKAIAESKQFGDVIPVDLKKSYNQFQINRMIKLAQNRILDIQKGGTITNSNGCFYVKGEKQRVDKILLELAIKLVF